jgi:hypothetical protein
MVLRTNIDPVSIFGTRGHLRHAQTVCGVLLLALWPFCGCQPINDLNVAASEFGRAGREGKAGEAGSAGALPAVTPNQGGDSGSAPVGASGQAGGSAGSAASEPDSNQGGDGLGGAIDSTAGGAAGFGGNDGTTAGSGGNAGVPTLPLPDLPNDLPNSPVPGRVSCSTGSYSSGPIVLSTFEIDTPTASYSISRSSGNMLSINDKTSANVLQWVGYSDFRSKRGVGVTTSPQPAMRTTLDEDSVTAKHVRLVARAVTGGFTWVWDFYVTQATLTVTQAATRYGFTYRGAPGGALDDGDRLGISSSELQPASDSFYADLPGPAEWAYVSDPMLNHSLFLIQHRDDALSERYESKDADSASWTFGDGMISETPTRFSVGMLGSAAFPAVQARVAFIVEALR